MADQQNDTEITLGVGKLLGLFFLLVILCGVFLGLGYMLGSNSAKQAIMPSGDAIPAGSISTTAKPGASQMAPVSRPSVDTQQQAIAQKVDTTDTNSQLPNSVAQTGQPTLGTDAKQAADMKIATMGGGYIVQVAAVTKKEDADALQQALQHKQYPVVISSGAADKLYHVQIGPFADVKDAETMKTKLAADGYNAIVKR